MVDACVQVLRLSILARFLSKSDFGIVAIISVILGLTTTFGDLGFSVGIMSKKDITNKEFSSVFWLQLLLFAFLYIVFTILSPFVSKFYSEPLISVLMPVSLLNLFFWGIGKLYDTVLQKNMEFKTLAVRNIIASLLSLILAYIFCLLNFGIYSLILSTLIYTACINIWNFIAGQHKNKLLIHLSFSEVKPFFKIGIYKTGTQILDYFSSKLDVLIIGKVLGMDMLGLYNIAKDLISRLISMVQTINIKISTPILAKIQDDVILLQRYYHKIINICAFVIFPICVATILFSKEIIFVLYGSKYLDAVPLLQLFAVLFMINGITGSEGILVSALGRTDMDFKWTVLRILLVIPIVWIMSNISIRMVIIGQILIALVGFVYIWKNIIYKLIFLKLSNYFKAFYKELISSLLVSGALYFIIYDNIFALENIIYKILLYGIIFIATYAIVLLLVDKKNMLRILSLLKS